MLIYHSEKVAPFSVVKEAGADALLPSGRRVTLPAAFAGKRLTLRTRRAGDRFKGEKLKKLLGDKKLSLLKRDSLVLAEEEGEIIWVESVYDAFSKSSHKNTAKKLQG